MADSEQAPAATAAALYADYGAALAASREAGARLQAAVEAEIRAELHGEWVALDNCTFVHWLWIDHGRRHWLIFTRRFTGDYRWSVSYHRGTHSREPDFPLAYCDAEAQGRTLPKALWALVGLMKIPPLRSHEITSLIRRAP